MRKLVKAWNKLPAGAAVTTDPAEQVVLVDKERLAILEREGHLVPRERPEMERAPGQQGAREIPAEVRTVVAASPEATPAKTAIKPGLLPDETEIKEP